MITMLGSKRRLCDGLTRRETLKAGALSLLGGAFNLPSLLWAEENRKAHARPGKATSVILLYLLGGEHGLGTRIATHRPRRRARLHLPAPFRGRAHCRGRRSLSWSVCRFPGQALRPALLRVRPGGGANDPGHEGPWRRALHGAE